MEKTRDLFKNIRDTKGIFLAKMGSIKEINGVDLTETEDIKKKRQEYTESHNREGAGPSWSHRRPPQEQRLH